MRNKGSFSKLVWLLLVAAFVAIAGGGCGGSSSGGGGDDVTNVGKTEHPLLDYLREHADPETLQKIKDRVHVVGNTMTLEELEAAMPELQEAYAAGKIIGVFGPRQELIDELHAGLGVKVARMGSASDEQTSEFYMITRRNGIVFDNKIHYVPGSADQGLPISGDGSLIEKLRTKADHYPAFAEKIAGWHDRVTELAEEVSADRKVAAAELRAAADVPNITDISNPLIHTWYAQFADEPSGQDKHPYKFPMINMTVKMWSSYSFQADKNIYLVKTSGSMNPGDNYEWWKDGREYQINFTALYKSWAEMKGAADGKLALIDHTPHSLNKVTNYDESFSWNFGGHGELGGEIGGSLSGGTDSHLEGHINFDPSIGLSAGVEKSHSKSWTVYDYEVHDLTNGTVPSVWYEFTYVDPEDQQKLLTPSIISRSNFTSDEAWIWTVDRSADPYKFDHHIRYESQFLRSTGTVLWFDKNDGEAKPFGREKSEPVDLPIPPSLVTTKIQFIVNSRGYETLDDPVYVGLLSSGEWTASSDVDWIDLAVKSGGKTGGTHRDILVDIKENPDSQIRIGHITFTGPPALPNDPKSKPQTAVIEIQQQGAKK